MGQPADHGHHHDHASPHTGGSRIVRTQLSRRLFVQEFGRRTMAVAILGTATVACASDASGDTSDVSSDASESGTEATSTPVPATTAPDPTTEPAATEVADDSASVDSGELRWEQASFGFVSAYVLARGNEFAVVDTGLAGSVPQIGQALGVLGAKFDDLDHVILTHLHGDHVGGLPDLLDVAASSTAYAGEADVAGIESPRAITAVNDGDDVFGLRVVGTPGHTAGHICLYDETARLLIAGDAVVESAGAIEGPPEQFNADGEMALTSAKSLAALQFDDLLVAHGNPVLGGASALVANAFG